MASRTRALMNKQERRMKKPTTTRAKRQEETNKRMLAGGLATGAQEVRSSAETNCLSGRRKWLSRGKQVRLGLVLLVACLARGEAGILESIMQHKYGLAHTLVEEPLNSSSSTVLEHYESPDGRTTSLEYRRSPIEGLMDLISGNQHQTPIIVLSSEPGSPRQTLLGAHPAEESVRAGGLAGLPESGEKQASEQVDHQQWAIIGPAQEELQQAYLARNAPLATSQLMASAGSANGQSALVHQPLIGTSGLSLQPLESYQQLHELEQQILARAAAAQPPAQAGRAPEAASSKTSAGGAAQPSQYLGSPAHLSAPVQRFPATESPVEDPSEPSGASDSRAPERKEEAAKGSATDDEDGAADEAEPGSSKEESADNSEASDAPEPDSSEGRSSGEQSSADEEEPEADSYSSSPSGSMNYHEKYDSDSMDEPTRHTTKDSGAYDAADSSSSGSSNSAVVGSAESAGAAALLKVGLNDDCLQCICRASSGCDYLLRCVTKGADERLCGPFQISHEYWRQAGSPGDAPNNFDSFEECANEADCAVDTVTNYMKRYHRDCDGDDNITCLDYARLHRLKPDECSQTDKLRQLPDGYWSKFNRCAQTYNQTKNGGGGGGGGDDDE